MTDQPTVVITGASAGIGFAALEALAQEAFVLAISRTRPPLAQFNGTWIQGDLRTAEQVADAVVDALRSADRPLDGLILCAVSYGAERRHTFLETSDSEWDEVMTVNVRSQFILTTRLLPLLLRRPRSFIVALTSDAALGPAPQRIAYGCSKAASYALFAGLASELAGSPVCVIQILPECQVVTRGMRSRRPPDFDFSGYRSPEIFKEPFRSIVRSRGAGMNGKRLTVS